MGGGLKEQNQQYTIFSDLYSPKTSHWGQEEGESFNKTNEKRVLLVSLFRGRTKPHSYLSEVPCPIGENLAQCLPDSEAQIVIE